MLSYYINSHIDIYSEIINDEIDFEAPVLPASNRLQ
jgi:hypothetical protein